MYQFGCTWHSNKFALAESNNGREITVATYQSRSFSAPFRRFWSVFSRASSSFLCCSYNSSLFSSASGSSANASYVSSSVIADHRAWVWRTLIFQFVIFHSWDFWICTGGQTEVVRGHFLINVYADYNCQPNKSRRLLCCFLWSLFPGIGLFQQLVTWRAFQEHTD